ncbi:MAG: hypothetical protein Q4B68_09750 [Bacteroidales bacterium]|nr:hypothetical protein [Bacteroidales bacterium]
MVKKILILCAVGVVVLAWLSASLQEERCRANDISLPASQCRVLIAETRGMDADQIVDYCVGRTCDFLSFQSQNEPIRYDRESGANCVNYAKLCASMCDVALNAHGYRCKAQPVVGHVQMLGVNVNKVVSTMLSFSDRWRNFTKDHDFVKIEFTSRDRRVVYVDASLKDVFFTSMKREVALD